MITINAVYTHLIKLRLLFLSRPKKLLFEHIPKSGGTTVTDFLKSQYSNEKIFCIAHNTSKSISDFKCLPEEKRFSYDLIVGHGAHQLRRYSHPEILKATIFRDPVDRIISHYFYVLRTPKHRLYKEVTNNRISLVDYATSGPSGKELRNNYVTRFLQIPADEAEKNAEESITRAYNLIRKEYAVIGLLDHLDAAMNTLAKSAHFHNQFVPKRLNVTNDRPKLKEIDQAVIRTIEEVNFLDVRLYKLIKADAIKNLN